MSWRDIVPEVPVELGLPLEDGWVVAYRTQDEYGHPGFVAVSPTGGKRWQGQYGKPGLQHTLGFLHAMQILQLHADAMNRVQRFDLVPGEGVLPQLVPMAVRLINGRAPQAVDMEWMARMLAQINPRRIP